MKLFPVTRKKRQAGLLRLAAGCLLLGLTAAMLASGVARAEPVISCDGKISLQTSEVRRTKGGHEQPAEPEDRQALFDRYCRGPMSTATSTSSAQRALLEFREPTTKGSLVNFWAKNIIVENGGTPDAGTATAPYGSRAGVLTIYLYGADQTKGLDPNVDANQGQGVLCQTTTIADGVGPCGIPTGRQAARISMAPGATTARLPSRYLEAGTRRATFSTNMVPCPGT